MSHSGICNFTDRPLRIEQDQCKWVRSWKPVNPHPYGSEENGVFLENGLKSTQVKIRLKRAVPWIWMSVPTPLADGKNILKKIRGIQ
jgi:hypothetical protein